MSTTRKSRLRRIATWVQETWAEDVYAQERLMEITGIRAKVLTANASQVVELRDDCVVVVYRAVA